MRWQILTILSDMAKYDFCEREADFSFAKNSTIGCGGLAKYAFYPKTEAELIRLVEVLRADDVPFHVLGCLSNVLPPSSVSSRAVILTKNMRGVTATEKGLYVQAGITGGALLRECKTRGKSGVEFLQGIPCTLGGVLYMNAGVADGHISDVVESVAVLRDGKRTLLSKEECAYGYKTSVFMQTNDVILGAELCLTDVTQAIVEENCKRYAEKRAWLPKGKSMGCVFKNPQGAIAGKLIESAGLKGLRIGGAIVSNVHANFIINDNGAKSSDVASLIQIIKNAVFAQYKIRLEEEIRYLD